MRSGIGISSVNDGKAAYTQEEAKDQQGGRGDRSRDKHRVGHRNRNTSSTCGSEAGERERGITPLSPSPLFVICLSPLMSVTPV